ncbi:hypothetical protein Tco_0101218 [Tanacetum coccineum]
MPVTAAISTASSVTSAFASLIYPISMDDYEVVPAAGQEGVGADANPFPNVDDAELNIQLPILLLYGTTLIRACPIACAS